MVSTSVGVSVCYGLQSKISAGSSNQAIVNEALGIVAQHYQSKWESAICVRDPATSISNHFASAGWLFVPQTCSSSINIDAPLILFVEVILS